ncbi:hypothetical protein OROGR_012626 [Orobanche gracilis]
MSLEVETVEKKGEDLSWLGCILGTPVACCAVLAIPPGIVIWALAESVGLLLLLLPGAVRKDGRCWSGYDDRSMCDLWVVY